MATQTAPREGWREYLRIVLIVTSREIRDFFRDWRLVIPIGILTLFFPFLANITCQHHSCHRSHSRAED